MVLRLILSNTENWIQKRGQEILTSLYVNSINKMGKLKRGLIKRGDQRMDGNAHGMPDLRRDAA